MISVWPVLNFGPGGLTMKSRADKKGEKRSTIQRWGISHLNVSLFRSSIHQTSKSQFTHPCRKGTHLANWSNFWLGGINIKGSRRLHWFRCPSPSPLLAPPTPPSCQVPQPAWRGGNARTRTTRIRQSPGTKQITDGSQHTEPVHRR